MRRRCPQLILTKSQSLVSPLISARQLLNNRNRFRCNAPTCSRISCRICNKDTHIPLTCEQAKKENGISERHVLEEAMSQALMKACPRCAKQIVKEDGCNKIKCPCGCTLCDCCGKDITLEGYHHFDSNVNPVGGGPSTRQKKCPVYDDTHMRQAADIKKAEQEALEALKKENPDLDEDDLEIKFSEATRSPPRPHMHHGVAIGHRIPPRLFNAAMPDVPNGNPANAAIDEIDRAQQRLRDMQAMMPHRHPHLAAFQRHNGQRGGRAPNGNVNNPQEWQDPFLMPMGYPPHGHDVRRAMHLEAVEADAVAGLANVQNLVPHRWAGPIPRPIRPIGYYAMPHYPLPADNQVAQPADPMFGGNFEFGANPF